MCVIGLMSYFITIENLRLPEESGVGFATLGASHVVCSSGGIAMSTKFSLA